jgi:hypothetical protein
LVGTETLPIYRDPEIRFGDNRILLMMPGEMKIHIYDASGKWVHTGLVQIVAQRGKAITTQVTQVGPLFEQKLGPF